jgi:hypothetical protein
MSSSWKQATSNSTLGSTSELLTSLLDTAELCVYCESESYVTTDGQSASLSWYKAPIRGLRPDFYCRTEYGIRNTSDSYALDSVGRLSDERTGLPFVCAAGPCQRSLSRVLVPWDLRPYFTVSDLRLPFHRLLRLAGSRWRYSTPPPHGFCVYSRMNSVSYLLGVPNRGHRVKQFIPPLSWKRHLRCAGNVSLRWLGDVCLEVAPYAMDSHVTIPYDGKGKSLLITGREGP